MSQVPAVILDASMVAARRRRQQTDAQPAAPVSANPTVAGLQRLTAALGANSKIKDEWIGSLTAQVRTAGQVPAAQPARYSTPRAPQGTGVARQIDGLTALRDTMGANSQIKDRWLSALIGQVKALGKVPAPQPRPFAKP